MPNTFIPLAEDVGLIAEVDRYVLERALGAVAGWYRRGTRLRVSVNLSARSFWKLDLVGLLERLLRERELPGEAIILELTERILARSEQIRPVLRDLRALGLRVAIDDFGAGHSSLAYLRELPIDVIKIDRMFVGEIGRRRESEAVVRTVITLAHELGAEVVAEGVETADQADWLAAEGCDLVQGFYTGRPVNEREFLQTYTG